MTNTIHLTKNQSTETQLKELQREATFGGAGEDADDREVRVIDMSDFENRRAEITEQLWLAATEIGFFQLSNHGISSKDIEAAFAESDRFFNLPEAIKSQYPRPKGVNAGWESRSQIRPSTGTKDEKESYQITQYHMDNLWPVKKNCQISKPIVYVLKNNVGKWECKYSRALRTSSVLTETFSPRLTIQAKKITKVHYVYCTTSLQKV
ncbi:2-oxoglutarate and iron-dependent oxygenase domain-containing protein [Marinomonas sp. GJ51-6]|uniref:2-oxoglutarate and iron-dependent oxygenase domain-containing protein n=1 Tax=Marinomonas sp. GJ51-6 TaxID=2992802 RepID=UPI002934D238|nr:2-oxoglutarate and iron-dependent oxygenase domain-containing protein [Marinomonas sp. GJ51-6]WOD07691.1 2-oxoglutarate and iron-dependent oxygenase domain-containing protein [Marinomonas sp. GJ51-6]